MPRAVSPLAAVVFASWALSHLSNQSLPSNPALAELWVEPEPDRDLFHGVGGRRLAPDPADEYKVIEVKVGGFSEGYTVVDSAEREWSAKFPPEAAIEVVASRIHWGVGYHQPPVHLLREWNAKGARTPNPQLPARFREKEPDLLGLDSGDDWSLRENPFTGTRALAGLLVLQVILDNPDLKASNNTVYELASPSRGARRWFVVRDLGYAFRKGKSIERYERQPWIRRVADDRVEFVFGGLYAKVVHDAPITPADVVWICERLDRLTDRQWRDAFRAGHYEPSLAERYVAAIKRRIAEGLALRR